MFKAFSGNKYLKKSLNKMCVEPNHKTRVFFFFLNGINVLMSISSILCIQPNTFISWVMMF